MLDLEVEVRAGRVKAAVVLLGFEVRSLICIVVVAFLFADERKKCESVHKYQIDHKSNIYISISFHFIS